MPSKCYTLTEELRAELHSILEEVYEGCQNITEPEIPIETLLKLFKDPIIEDVLVPYQLPMFTDEDRQLMFNMVLAEAADISIRDMAELLMDDLSLISCIGYALPPQYDVEDLARMLQHLDNPEEDYLNGEFLRENDNDGDGYAELLDYSKRMGLIDENETELTERGKEFVGENI